MSRRMMLVTAALALTIGAVPAPRKTAPAPAQRKSVPAPAQRTTVASLAWMSGAWVEETPRGWTEERWSPPRGGVMLGTGLNGRGGSARDFEYMRIAADADGTVTFWGSPRGRTAVPFRLISVLAGQVVFENPRHDFPTRIAYRRTGDTLVATISGPGGANAQSWRYRKAAR